MSSTNFGPAIFNYGYLTGTNLLSKLNCFNNAFEKVMTYDADRNLPMEIKYQTKSVTPVLLAKKKEENHKLELAKVSANMIQCCKYENVVRN